MTGLYTTTLYSQMTKEKEVTGAEYVSVKGYHKADVLWYTGLVIGEARSRNTVHPHHMNVSFNPIFQAILSQYSSRYQALLGTNQLGNVQADNIRSLLINGNFYTGSDESEKDGIGAHAYGFTSSGYMGTVWG